MKLESSTETATTPSRVRILGRLRAGASSVNDLAEVVAMEPSAVSHQLRLLRHLGFRRRDFGCDLIEDGELHPREELHRVRLRIVNRADRAAAGVRHSKFDPLVGMSDP